MDQQTRREMCRGGSGRSPESDFRFILDLIILASLVVYWLT